MTYTRHTPHYVNGSQWEYKIVRARNAEFSYRHHLHALVEQEAQAGWVLVEKYNDSQVRFRRSYHAREWDQTLPPHIDPYRTIYIPVECEETTTANMILLTGGVTLAIIIVVTLSILMALLG